ncbi:MAG: insulinase family protein [Deltaproteobacteria bacterium]|nr:insulinase family protein [Deltaproteobacteria bacterium]MDQ3297780.1 insulinase family protein [Myxococcota bacterium]
MTTRRLLTLALLALVACGGPKAKPDTTLGGGDTTTTTTGGTTAVTPPATGDDAPLPLWASVKRGKLANGLTYYIMRHKQPEKRALLWLAVNAGAVQEDDDQRGLAHFVEHMAFNGTKRFPKAEIINYLEKIGMGFGADLNAYTSFDETVYTLTVPTDDKTFVPKGFDILRDWAADVAFDAAEVDKERGVVLEEWRLGRGAFQRLFDKQAKVLFKGSRYGERLPIGQPEILKQAPRDALVRYYKDWYRPDLMAVIAVGDFEDTAAIEKAIHDKFGDLKNPPNPRMRPPAGVPKADGTRVSIETDKELPVQIVSVYNMLAHRGESSAKDMRRMVAEQVYQTILNERLGTLARRKEAPFAAAFAGAQGFTREIDAFTRTAQVKAGKVEDSLRVLFLEVLRVEKHGFTQAELDRARSVVGRAIDQAAVQEDTNQSSEYAQEMTRNFFEGELMIGRRAERELTMKFLPTITLAELNMLAASYGGADNRAIVIAGPEGKPLPDQKRVLEIVAEVSKAEIDPWQDKAAATALMAQPPKPGTVTKESKVASIGVTEWTLSNGARVIVKPTDFEADAVSISGNSPGGLAMATAKQFPDARFADDIVAAGGIAELDDEALGKVLAGKQVQVSASLSETLESVDATGSVRDLETMFQLLHLRMTAPRKDDQAIAVWKQNTSEALANQLRVPEVQYSIESSKVLFQGNLRRKPPTPADIEKINPDKAIAFYKERFGDAADFTFVIVGAVDLTKLKPLVETYLASLPAKGRKEKEKDPGVRRAKGVIKKSWPLGSEPKARVAITFHGDEKWTRDHDRDMFVLSQVLGTKLRESLREDLGGVYGVGASGYISRSPRQERTFTIQFGCDPTRVDELVKAAQVEIDKVRKDGVSAEYLDKVKAQFTREREVQLRNNGFWSSWLETSYRFNDDPTIVLDPSKMIARMTSDHVKAAAKRFLDGKHVYQAVMVPAPGVPAAKPADARGNPKTVPGAEKPTPKK